MYSLNKIEEFEDESNYLIEQVDCVERPLFVTIKSYNEWYAHLYLLFLKLSQCYYLGNEYENKQYSFIRSRYILEKEFDVKFDFINSDNLIEGIENEIDKNNPVFVLVNLRDIYYSNFYKKSDWIHLILIKGYDRERKLFYIIDNVHRIGDSDKISYNFVIRYEMLISAYKSYCDNICNDYIYYIDSGESLVNSESNTLNYLLKGINYYINTDMEYFLNDNNIKLAESEDINSLSKAIIKMDHYREVFFNELSILLYSFLAYDKDQYNLFVSAKNNLMLQWKKATSSRLFSLRKKKEVSYEGLKDAENDVRRILKKITTELLKHKIVSSEEKNHNTFCLVNNLDNIISFVDDKTIQFKFNGDKIYNNWFTDLAPKVIYEFNENVDSIYFQTYIDFVQYNSNADIIAGIYLKTIKNEKYLWGSKSGQNVVFENTGVEPGIINLENRNSQIRLFINLSKDSFYLGYGNDEKNIFNIETNEILPNEVKEIGIICKTWNLPHKFLIRFYMSKLIINNKKDISFMIH